MKCSVTSICSVLKDAPLILMAPQTIFHIFSRFASQTALKLIKKLIFSKTLKAKTLKYCVWKHYIQKLPNYIFSFNSSPLSEHANKLNCI